MGEFLVLRICEPVLNTSFRVVTIQLRRSGLREYLFPAERYSAARAEFHVSQSALPTGTGCTAASESFMNRHATFTIVLLLFSSTRLATAQPSGEPKASKMPSKDAAESIIKKHDNNFYFVIDGKRTEAIPDPKFEFPKAGTPIDGTHLKIGDQIEIQGKLLSGKDYKLRKFPKGSATLVIFWSTKCSACLKEFPVEKAYFVKYKERGLRVVAVNSDEKIQQARRMKAKVGFPWATLFDGADGPIVRKLGITTWPTLLLLDHNRKILHATHVGKNGLRSQKISPPKVIYQTELTMSLAKLFLVTEAKSQR